MRKSNVLQVQRPEVDVWFPVKETLVRFQSSCFLMRSLDYHLGKVKIWEEKKTCHFILPIPPSSNKARVVYLLQPLDGNTPNLIFRC